MKSFSINANHIPSKIKQIVHAVSMAIDNGGLKPHSKLPSINDFSKTYHYGRDTVEKAYRELIEEGYVYAVAAKGYYVVGRKDKKLKVLLIFNKLSSYKKIIYYSFIETLQDKAVVDLQVHHYDIRRLEEILEANMGKYHYYVIMPHFFHKTSKKSYLKVLKSIPPSQLMIMDKYVPELGKHHMTVYQDFKQDIHDVLESSVKLLKKYQRIIIVFPLQSNHPRDIVDGCYEFCQQHGKDFAVISSLDKELPQAGTVYIVTAESDLAQLIKKSKEADLQTGKNVGIISFNETVLKELLEITVVTTDFEGMGSTAAQMLLNKEVKQVKNPFRMIVRKSL
ncbi:GntR family transcriptional regulator [Paraflavitalea soli]|uniref:GntR family transcriptional regulator n=1 Tax=Paraflavitalea soli TaxID=2315862 RepID=A0A3B7MEA7_9BACT|nr:GntR family transcriptional regulator [Paraflavitalea soli]AXY72612.1 GntR family transcriptional regulator [Paraflavitalea soli]